MAGIKSITLNVTSPVAGKVNAHVEAVLEFSPRELRENMDYGVNLVVLKYFADVSLFTRHKGITAMELHTIPQRVVNPKAAFPGPAVIKPTAASVTLPFDVDNTDVEWPSGTTLQAIVTVVPEIAEMVNSRTSRQYPRHRDELAGFQKSAKLNDASPVFAPGVTVGDLARDGKTPRGRMLGLQAIPSSLLYRVYHIEPLSLGLPKRLPVPDVANHLVCSVCGARNDEVKRPIHARPDTRVPGVTGKYPRW